MTGDHNIKNIPLFSQYKYLWIFIFLVLSIAYFSWQYHIYGSIFANTAGTKANGVSFSSLVAPERFKYLYDFFAYNVPYGMLSIAALIIFITHVLNRNLSATVSFALVFSLPGFALAFIGKHDYFQNFRYIAPYFPLYVFFVAATFKRQLNITRHSKTIGGFLFVLWLSGLIIDVKTENVMNNKFAFNAKVDKSEKQFSSFRRFKGIYPVFNVSVA